MKKTAICLSLFLFLLFPAFSQEKIHKKCGPAEYLNTRVSIQNDSLNDAPFNAIVHINIHGWGTATFINDSTLITAKHLTGGHINYINLLKNSFVNSTIQVNSIVVNKGEFKIVNMPFDGCHFISSDIAFIIFNKLGKEKIKSIAKSFLEVADYRSLVLQPLQNVYLTGYPVDLAYKGMKNSDILANKTTTFGSLVFAEKCKMVGYKIFTCSGDSGAPLWLNLNGKFYVIGIHHGGPEGVKIFNDENTNSAALIDNQTISTIFH